LLSRRQRAPADAPDVEEVARVPAPLPFAPSVLARRPEIAVSRLALGVTLYVDDGLGWGKKHAVEALDRFLRVVQRRGDWWFTTSMISSWRRISERGLPEVRAALGIGWDESRPRHLFWFRLVDDTNAPGVGFSYREVDDRRGARTGFLEIFLPQDESPRALLQLVLSVVEAAPFWSGVGGYVATWNHWTKPISFWSIFKWCRRFIGIDVQVPDEMAWLARGGLPGTGWLTLLGAPLINRLEIDVGALSAAPAPHATVVQELPRGALVRAGEAPTVGDVNNLGYPAAYAEAARLLAPYLVAAPPRLWGGFYDDDMSAKWFRRLLDPEGWR
jgi:hypothetical protein